VSRVPRVGIESANKNSDIKRQAANRVVLMKVFINK
jgi:hypothetical protein